MNLGGTSWDEHRAHWQVVLNRLPVPARSAQRHTTAPIPVRVRLVWGRDGEEFLATVATGWTTRAVLVRVDDVRIGQIRYAWLPAADVTRRAP